MLETCVEWMRSGFIGYLYRLEGGLAADAEHVNLVYYEPPYFRTGRFKDTFRFQPHTGYDRLEAIQTKGPRPNASRAGTDVKRVQYDADTPHRVSPDRLLCVTSLCRYNAANDSVQMDQAQVRSLFTQLLDAITEPDSPVILINSDSRDGSDYTALAPAPVRSSAPPRFPAAGSSSTPSTQDPPAVRDGATAIQQRLYSQLLETDPLGRMFFKTDTPGGGVTVARLQCLGKISAPKAFFGPHEDFGRAWAAMIGKHERGVNLEEARLSLEPQSGTPGAEHPDSERPITPGPGPSGRRQPG
jgi:hypothetical protein